MQTFDTGTIFLIYAVSFLISILILYSIISSATRSRQQVDLAKMQVKLLMSIAVKLGIDLDNVNGEEKANHLTDKEILSGKKGI